MTTVTLPEDQLYSRGVSIRRLLRPISKVTNGPAWQIANSPGGIAIGTYDGTYPGGQYRDWRFGVSVPDSDHAPLIQGMYFELWRRIPEEINIWALGRGYLSIYKVDHSKGEQELICLHCDPEEIDEVVMKYKKGPHLHIKAAEEPIPQSHIALARGHLDQVLANAESLTEAMAWSIEMIRDEILNKFL